MSGQAVWAPCVSVVSTRGYHITGDQGGIHAVVHVVVPAVDRSPAIARSSGSRYLNRSRSIGKLQRDSECRPTATTDRVAAESDESARELSVTMAVTLRRIQEFDGDKEEWCQYQERLEHFFRANEIEDETKKQSVFLTLIGANAYTLLRNLIALAKTDTKTYTELVQALANHYSPTPAESVQRFKFHSRVRRPEESVATFVAELCSLAEFCNFEGALEDMLHDCLVCGINDAGIQRRLLAEPKLSFKKAFTLAQGMESATQNVKQLQTAGTREEVPEATGTTHGQGAHKVSHPDQRLNKGANCYRCGRVGHSAARCRFKDVKCHHCGKIGHIKAACCLKGKGRGREATPTGTCGAAERRGKRLPSVSHRLAVQTP